MRMIALVALLIVSTLPAPSQEAPSWISFTFVSVKPEMDAQFQVLIESQWLPAVKKSDLPFMQTWRAARFGNLYEYLFVAPIENFASYDGQSPIQKAMAPGEYATLFASLSQCVNSVRTVAHMYRPDLSMANATPPKMAIVSTVMVKPGMGQAYEKLIKEILPHFEELDYKGVWSHQTVFGGSQNEWTHVTGIDNFAHIDKGPPLVRAVGPDGAAKLEAKFAEVLQAEKLGIYAFIGSLSHPTE